MAVFKGKIAGDVIVQKGDDTSRLTSVGGSLYVSEGAQCDLPQLTSVGGYPVASPAEGYARLKAIAQEVLPDPAKLDMGKWHGESRGCGTSHCIAGWAVHLEPGGYDLEKKVGSTHKAGNILLGVEASKLFFLKDDEARSALHRVMNDQPIFPAKEEAAGG